MTSDAQQRRFRANRARINRERVALTEGVRDRYESGCRDPDVPLLIGPDWVLPEPVPVADVDLGLTWSPKPEPSDHGAKPLLMFGSMRYFDFIDAGEALAYESASSGSASGGDQATARTAITDPFDLEARPCLTAINTLTVYRDDEQFRFLLHKRATRKVPVAGGCEHVIPAGGFQPAVDDPAATARDLSLWRNIMREYDEELLGTDEARGAAGIELDYSTQQPYAQLDQGVAEGVVVPWYFGVALDPLTLCAEVLTTVVFHGASFEETFADRVRENAEGSLSGVLSDGQLRGHPFVEGEVRPRLAGGELHPAAHACLALAWRHRHRLLGLS